MARSLPEESHAMKTLRLLLASQTAPWCAIIASTIATIVNLTVGEGQPWRGEYLWTAEWVTASQFLSLAPTAMAAAFDAQRLFRVSGRSLFATDEFRAPTLRRSLVLVGVMHSLPVILGASIAASSLGRPVDDLWIIAPAYLLASIFTVVATIGLAYLAGIVAGRWGIVAAACGCLILGSTALGSGTSFLALGGSSGSLVGLTIAPWVFVLHLMYGAAALTLFAMAVRDADRGGNGRVLGAFALGVVVTGLVLPSMLPERWVTLTSLPQDCMDGGAVGEACVLTEHERMLPGLHASMSEFQRVVTRYELHGAQERVMEGYPGFDGDSQTAVWRPTPFELADESAGVTQEGLIRALSQPSYCPAVRRDEGPEDAHWEAVEAVERALTTLLSTDASESRKKAAADVYNTAWPRVRDCEAAR